MVFILEIQIFSSFDATRGHSDLLNDGMVCVVLTNIQFIRHKIDELYVRILQLFILIPLAESDQQSYNEPGIPVPTKVVQEDNLLLI